MKVAIVLFLCLVLPGLEPFNAIEGRFSGNETLYKYVPMEQDATRVEQQSHRYFSAIKKKSWPVHALTHGEGPVIKQDTSSRWDDKRFPTENYMVRQRLYGILPDRILFPGVKKRFLETLLVRRNGRKHEYISDGYF